MSQIVVHIDRLVVSGPADRREIEAAVRDAIGKELSRPGAVDGLVASGSRDRVDGGKVRATAGHSALGAAIGRSLTGGGGSE